MADQSLGALRQDLTPRFLAYLANRDEAGLRAAYELGRRAMRQGVGLLDFVRVHDEVVLDVLATARTVDSAHDIAHAASVFLVEALASFEMAQRGFMDMGVRDGGGRAAAGRRPPPRD
jgi:Phosphoserine phosphatase RsbU, N-terminal domain